MFYTMFDTEKEAQYWCYIWNRSRNYSTWYYEKSEFNSIDPEVESYINYIVWRK